MHIFTAFCSLVILSTSCGAASHKSHPQWSGWGANILNNRWATSGSTISPSNAGTLRQSCLIQFSAGVSAPPAISGDIAYFPTWNGRFIALDFKV